MIRDYQAIGCTWFLRGHQRKIPTYGQHKGVKLIGTLDYETGRIICTEEGAYDAAAFLRFLERTLREYPTGKIVMVLDNARIHHAKLIQPFLKENAGRLALIFLPPYSPQLNLMEGVWKWLKESVEYCKCIEPPVRRNEPLNARNRASYCEQESRPTIFIYRTNLLYNEVACLRA